ncbi:hypothetical protein GCM10022221_66750 [Actinocorallia aurea]
MDVTDVCRLAVPIEDDDVQGCSGDILADRNQDYRFRLAGRIGVAESEIAVIVRCYRERYADRAFGERSPIRDHWGVSQNPFVAPGGTVDAAFVWQDTYTYLFSGDRYVRYTGPEYAAVDPGYPKKTAVNLRQEPPFTNLPEAFRDGVNAAFRAPDVRLLPMWGPGDGRGVSGPSSSRGSGGTVSRDCGPRRGR